MDTLHVQQFGEGPTQLLLLHGFCENSTIFSELIQYLPKTIRIHCVDLPGFGKSSVQTDLDMPKIAQAIAKFMHEQNIASAFVLGHSMGGYAALELLSTYPEKIAGIGLIHSNTKADTEERIQTRHKVIRFIQEHGKAAYLQDFIPTLFNDKVKHSAQAAQAIAAGMSSSEAGILEGIHAMIKRRDHTETLLNFSGKTFFGIGKYDALIPENVLFELASKCRQSYICYLHESAHNGMLEEPEKLALGILDWLKTELG